MIRSFGIVSGVAFVIRYVFVISDVVCVGAFKNNLYVILVFTKVMFYDVCYCAMCAICHLSFKSHLIYDVHFKKVYVNL